MISSCSVTIILRWSEDSSIGLYDFFSMIIYDTNTYNNISNIINLPYISITKKYSYPTYCQYQSYDIKLKKCYRSLGCYG